MAVVKMRDLLRQPGSVFAQLETTREPVLVTRNGEAIAALFPVDPQEVAHIAMAALPEFAESRRRAEHARREGRTLSQEDIERDLAARHDATEEPSAETREGLLHAFATLFGEANAHELAPQLDARIADASEPVLRAAAVAGLPASEAEAENPDDAKDELRVRIYQLTGKLFEHLLAETLESKVSDRLATHPIADADENEQEGVSGDPVLGKPLAVETLEAVTERARWFNSQISDFGNPEVFSLPVYEAFIKGVAVSEGVQRTKTRLRDPIGSSGRRR